MGLHTGTPLLTAEGYVGVDIHRAARIAACGNGGQVLVSASTASLLGLDGLLDLGLHRLKDLSAPERIYQLGMVEFPPLSSLYKTNLPVPSTPFLGREQELQEVIGLLSREDVRLLTLTGAGGTGKTRLGLQAAAELSERYLHGVWWVPLASLRDPGLVLATTRQALGAKGDLAEHIADRSMLLLMDNFEQVVESAADVANLLARCPKLDLLVTSREPLHVMGEQEYPVPPLFHNESIALFLARARSVNPGFHADEAVSEICRRLDDLPLALELAAARVKALSSRQILQRLERRLPLLSGGGRDLPERQRTLRATIEWSYELLGPEEQQLFARLAVFAGGCTLEAAEQVTQAQLDTLQALVDKSLLRHTQERFWMLETIREYAAELLQASGETREISDRHATYYCTLAEAARLNLREGVDHLSWLPRLETESDNLRTALTRTRDSGQEATEVRLIVALAAFWVFDHWDEGRHWLTHALEHRDLSPEQRVAVLTAAGTLANVYGDQATALTYAEERLAACRLIADPRLIASALNSLGVIAAYNADYPQARKRLEESRALALQANSEHFLGTAVLNLGWLALHEGVIDQALALFTDAVKIARQADRPLLAGALNSLSLALRRSGSLDAALVSLREALELARGLEFRAAIGECLEEVAAVATLQGRFEQAAQLLGAARTVREELGARRPAFEQQASAFPTETLHAALNEQAFNQLYETGRAMKREHAIELALSLT
jgi:predicted ATPase